MDRKGRRKSPEDSEFAKFVQLRKKNQGGGGGGVPFKYFKSFLVIFSSRITGISSPTLNI